MLFADNVKCLICCRIFCCTNCRKLHEEKEHAEESIHKGCFICHGKPYLLQKDISKLLIEHIAEKHLPLHCRKCDKIYNSMDDFKEIEKCSTKEEDIVSKDESENKENIPNKSTTTTTTKIVIEEVDEELLTPLSKINLKWRRKSTGFVNSDSVASVSGISNQSHLKIVTGSSTKLVRTTSTPMNQLSIQPGNLDSLCGSSYQASSIDHSSSGGETDQSASITSNNCSPSPNVAMKRTQFAMQHAQPRHRFPKAQTPLRQVMSKSIQRALIEQRNERTKLLKHIRMPRKMTFDSMSSSDGSMDDQKSSKHHNVTGVLDLRTTPALKRSLSAPICSKNPKIQTIYRKSEESLIVEALIEENYEHSSFRAKIDAISDNVINETKDETGISPIPLTPKIEENTATQFLSCLEEKTPVKKSPIADPMLKNIDIDNSFARDIWYSPKNISQSIQLPTSPLNIKTCDSEPEMEDEVFAPTNQSLANQPQNPIWRLFSTVMKMASGSSTEEVPNNSRESPKKSLITRSLSHFGIIRAAKHQSSPNHHLKRKRKTSSQSGSNYAESNTVPELRSPVAKKYKTITGRKPIQRMLTK